MISAVYIYCILLLSIYIIWTEVKCSPKDSTHGRGDPKSTDDTSVLLDRMEWVSLRPNRVNYVTRYLMWGLWVTFFASFLLLNKLPNPRIFLQSWIGIFIVIISLHGFYHWHSDKFADFAHLKGINMIRERLGLKKGREDLSTNEDDIIKGSGAYWTFTHEDYAQGTRFPGTLKNDF